MNRTKASPTSTSNRSCGQRPVEVTAKEVWAKFYDGLPKASRDMAGDRGLDRTPTWGRIYWGGAMFWFMVRPGNPQSDGKYEKHPRYRGRDPRSGQQ